MGSGLRGLDSYARDSLTAKRSLDQARHRAIERSNDDRNTSIDTVGSAVNAKLSRG